MEGVTCLFALEGIDIELIPGAGIDPELTEVTETPVKVLGEWISESDALVLVFVEGPAIGYNNWVDIILSMSE